ncbi:MAG: transcriptional regulator [Candidatus Riflebacteria bacterium]|nr:transcriptional regulator [Candidatus Riflebacteria bacterium]
MMNNKPTVVVPEDPKKRAEIIFALEYQLANDTNEKDREIHRAALEKLKAAK